MAALTIKQPSTPSVMKRGAAAVKIPGGSAAAKIKAKATKRMGGKSPTAAKIGAQMMEAY